MKHPNAYLTRHCDKVLSDIAQALKTADAIEAGDWKPSTAAEAEVIDTAIKAGITPESIREHSRSAILDHIGKIVWMNWPLYDMPVTVGAIDAVLWQPPVGLSYNVGALIAIRACLGIDDERPPAPPHISGPRIEEVRLN